MKLYLFYNGDDLHVPVPDRWPDWRGQDGARLALITAQSWRDHGWQVEQFAVHGDNNFWSGELASSPYRFNNFLPALMSRAEGDAVWWSTTDVFNRTFWIENAAKLEREGADVVLPCDSGQFTLAAGYATKDALAQWIDALRRMEQAPMLQPTQEHMPCDEYWLRHADTYYPELFGQVKTLKAGFMTQPMNGLAPLVHYSRTSIRFCFPPYGKHFQPNAPAAGADIGR